MFSQKDSRPGEVNCVVFGKIYRQESNIILVDSCTDSSNVLCLSLLELEEHLGSDILDKGKGEGG